ncbi:MAG: glycosyltransferase family 4 protein, partial [Armatimonadota bacterium]|nr:glycosyltransferase family 4 protein [Armatimonadota bacterium]
HRVPPQKVMRIAGGVDTVRFRPVCDRAALRRSLGLPTDRRVLLTVRNLVPRMGLENLLAAMVPVCARFPDALLIIGGSGPLAEPLRMQARDLGLSAHVRFAGFIPEDALPGYYAAADLFVLPTRCLEGFGLVTIEAMACGTPVLGTPVGGTQEILQRFDPALLFAGTEPDHLADGILRHLRRVCGDEALRTRCRRYVEEHYSWDVVIDRVEAIFCQVAAQGRRTAAGPPVSGVEENS